MKILLLDNYDSFTFNLYQALASFPEVSVEVKRNNQYPPGYVHKFDRLVISPGPGLPANAGSLMSVLNESVGRIPVLGICLGLQAIWEFYGGKLKNLDMPLHGVSRQTTIIKPDILFNQIPSVFVTGHYHSWVADERFKPEDLDITSVDEDNNIMTIKHRLLPITATQFHPESVLTPQGNQMLFNWISG